MENRFPTSLDVLGGSPGAARQEDHHHRSEDPPLTARLLLYTDVSKPAGELTSQASRHRADGRETRSTGIAIHSSWKRGGGDSSLQKQAEELTRCQDDNITVVAQIKNQGGHEI